MNDRQNQVLQFLYDHTIVLNNKGEELQEIATMMRNCLDELKDTQKKLDVAMGALKRISESYPVMTNEHRMKIANMALTEIKRI